MAPHDVHQRTPIATGRIRLVTAGSHLLLGRRLNGVGGHVVAVPVDDAPSAGLASVHVGHAECVVDIGAPSRRCPVALDADRVGKVAAGVGSEESAFCALATAESREPSRPSGGHVLSTSYRIASMPAGPALEREASILECHFTRPPRPVGAPRRRASPTAVRSAWTSAGRVRRRGDALVPRQA